MKRITPLLVPLFLLAAGCAGTALRPDDTQQQEIQALKARIVELQREAAMNQVEMAQLRQRVAEMEARNGGARPAAPAPARPTSGVSSGTSAATTAPSTPPSSAAPARPPAPAPVTAPAPEPRREPARPVTAAPAPAVIEPIEEVDIDLPANEPQPPPRRNPAPAPAKPAPAPAPASPSAPPSTGTAGPGGEPLPETLSPANQVLYDRGYTLYYQGRYVDAEASFQRFLQANPASELADNAQYWIGECRYARNDIKGALSAFRETIERFPKGNKVADAMLKSGQCLEAMGDIEGARVTYREVGRRFPGTAAAAAADERRTKLP
ncbi:MAG TPA: tol-pal system protein YbgF [Thermoanaerobaculia bacterium]|jgi:tol-pal system protein YbgF|nr:tol-pal system protein YbgF [Thermoanaerobaculia bacterium]